MNKEKPMKIYPIKFKSEKDEAAHRAWCTAMQIIGGPSVASELSGIRQSTLSTITNGRKIKSKVMKNVDEYYRVQVYPTIEQALKISLLTDCQITAEKLLPSHNFKYLYTYVKIKIG